jgi:predicted secreted protein
VKKVWLLLSVVAVAACVAASAALSSAPPVGALPSGPTATVKTKVGGSFTITLAKSPVAGRVWRIARAFNGRVVSEIREGETKTTVWLRFRALAPGTTKIVVALTRGETAHAYAARTYRVIVTRG